jgi:hypothetical protein
MYQQHLPEALEILKLNVSLQFEIVRQELVFLAKVCLRGVLRVSF